MRVHRLYLIFGQTGNRLHLLRELVQQLRGELRVDNLTQELFVVDTVDIQHILYQLEGIATQLLGILIHKVIVVQTTVGL